MRYIPYEKFDLITSMPAEEVRQRLIPIVKTKCSFSFRRRGHSPYVGKIGADKFLIYSNENRNSFLPRIKGQMMSDPTEARTTRIQIVMRPGIPLYAFLGFIILSPGVVVFLLPFSMSALIPLGVAIVIYSLLTYTFRTEISKSRNFLTRLFKAESAPRD